MLKLSSFVIKPKLIVSEYLAIGSNSFAEYDLQTLTGALFEAYDFKAVTVTLRLKDTTPASLKFDTYVGIDNTNHGIFNERYLRIFNDTVTDLEDLYLAVTVPLKIPV